MTGNIDTNVLVRIAVEDDPEQAEVAKALFARAEPVVITSQTLCEFVWVLASSYKMPKPAIAAALRSLTHMRNIIVDRPTVQAGLSMLDEGGDFADGIIVSEGLKLGATRFLSFDRKAVRLAKEAGFEAVLLR